MPGVSANSRFEATRRSASSGFEEFPASYKGVSGGGIWYQRFVSTDGKTYDVEPILAGVAVWQSKKPSVKKGYKVRTVTGHGWVSIYGHARSALAEKRASKGSF